jgi:hypothetical protein
MLKIVKLASVKIWLRLGPIFTAIAVSSALVPIDAAALPVFARQTGQNCVACHAGGQFPELTPYGRMFKMTGYTIGSRTVPLSVMGIASYAKVADTAKSDNTSADFQKNGDPIFASGSLFIAGKVTDNVGAFTQITYDNYATQDSNGAFHGHSQADNMDIRYADHFIDATKDLVYGVSLNNNPSVTDPWNTAPAWMQYVPVPSPTSYQFTDGAAPYPGYGAGGNIAGISTYLFWNKTIYAELGAYKSANGAFSFMSEGIDSSGKTYLKGINNPYWRIAYSHEWGANNVMFGTSGMIAHVFDPGSDTSDSNNLGRFRNIGIDSQYQYILDPHVFTAQLAYMRQVQNYSVNSLSGVSSPYFLINGVTPVAPINSSDTINVFRAKVSYIHKAKVGGSLAYFGSTGTTNTLNQSSGYDTDGQITSTDPLGTGITSTRVNGNLTGNPATRGLTYELFWTPIQYVRIGVQYTAYSKYNGASANYDGFGRNASDNNTLFLYLWAVY